MVKIIATENTVSEITGKLHAGPINVDGKDLTFDTLDAAIKALAELPADFVSDFNHFHFEIFSKP